MKRPRAAKSPAPAPAPDERSVLSMLREIQSGTLHPSALGTPDRQAIVEHLTAEGYSSSETAEILKISERTIARARNAIRAANALARDPELVGQMIGQLWQEAQNCITRIRRAARDKEASPAVRVDAEHRVYLILSDLTNRLQSVGYLPSASHKIKAELTHQIVESDDPSVLRDEIVRLLQIDVDGSKSDAASSTSPLKSLEEALQRVPTQVPANPSKPEPEEPHEQSR